MWITIVQEEGIFMSDNSFKDKMKFNLKKTIPSKDKAKIHCRHLTDEEIERIKRICLKNKEMSIELECYYCDALKKCLKSIIFAGIINIKGYDVKDLISQQTEESVKDEIEGWFSINEEYLNIKIWNSDNGLFYSVPNEIDRALSSLLVPGYEKEQDITKEDTQK